MPFLITLNALGPVFPFPLSHLFLSLTNIFLHVCVCILSYTEPLLPPHCEHCHCLMSFTLLSQFCRSVVSDSLRPHEPQHARPPCPSPTPEVHPNSSPLRRWCHPTISSSGVPFSCPQSFPASGSFPLSQLFTWGGQSTGVSALASFLPKKSQGWSPIVSFIFQIEYFVYDF